MSGRDLQFTATFNDQVSDKLDKVVNGLAAVTEKIDAEGKKVVANTAANSKKVEQIHKQAAIAEASLVADRFERMISVQKVKHAQILASVGANLEAIQAAERLNAAKIAKIRMDQKNFPDTPFQRLLSQLGQVTSKFGSVPASASKAEAAIRNLGSQAGFLALGGLAKAAMGAAKAGSAIKEMGGRVATSFSIKDIAKFIGLNQVMQRMQELGKTVFESALKQSPQLSSAVEKMKAHFNSLLTEIAGKVIPGLIAGFEFLLKHWDEIRYGVSIGIAVLQDAFWGLKGVFEFLAVGVLNGGVLITNVLERVGVVAKGTTAQMQDAATEMAESSLASFSKMNNSAEVLKKGMEGMSKAPKANVDFFGKGAAEEVTVSLESALDAMQAGQNKAAEFSQAAQDAINGVTDEFKTARKESTEAIEAVKRTLRDSAIGAMPEAKAKRLAELDASRQDEVAARKLSSEYALMSEEEKEREITNINLKYANERIAINKEEADKKAESEKEANQQRLAAVGGFFAGFAALAAQANMKDRSARLRWKATAIAEATANTALAATKSLSAAPYPFNLVLMAGTIAAGLAQVMQIKEQKFARGTDYAPGGMALVGEQGPEMVYLPRGSQVKTASETRQRMGATFAPQVNIHMAPGTTAADARAIGDAVDQRLRALAKDMKEIEYRGITA